MSIITTKVICGTYWLCCISRISNTHDRVVYLWDNGFYEEYMLPRYR